MQAASWSARLKAGLARTRAALGGGLGALLERRRLDEALVEELETALLGADCGVAATQAILDALRLRVKQAGTEGEVAIRQALREVLVELLRPLEQPLDVSRAKPCVIMIAGVNGSGKTTSIGKLAKWLQDQGKSVLLAAGDTFRAAAREQLIAWGERNGVAVISQAAGDAGAVTYDAVQAARSRVVDVLLADTAGRLPTQLHLMDEIKKVKRVIAKALPDAPHEVLLVVDAGNGQNALAQVEAFDRALGLTGLVLTKLDGTAKGGVICAIAQARSASSAQPRAAAAAQAVRAPLPVYFVGVGEGIDDLRPFSAHDFVEALLD